MRGRLTVLVIGMVLGMAAVVPPATADQTPTGREFIGNCVFNGTVVPYTEFRGFGTCKGTLNGTPYTKISAEAYAVAEGITVPEGPILQQGSGWVRFADALATEIPFTFDQAGSTINFHADAGGEAAGEIALQPAEPGSDTRRATVTANTITPMRW